MSDAKFGTPSKEDVLWAETEYYQDRIRLLEEALKTIAERAETTTGTRDGAYYRSMIFIQTAARRALEEDSNV